MYLIETAEKGIAWMNLTAGGTAGHGSMVHPDNAVTALAAAVGRLGSHEFPVRLTKTVRAFLERACMAYGVEFDPERPEACLAEIGPLARMIGATLRNTLNPTRLDAGYKTNVIPQSATAQVDGRFLPGTRTSSSRRSTSCWVRASNARSSITITRWRRSTRGRSSRRWSSRCWRRIRGRCRCRTA